MNSLAKLLSKVAKVKQILLKNIKESIKSEFLKYAVHKSEENLPIGLQSYADFE